MSGAGAPKGNRNAVKAKLWTQAIKRALMRVSPDKDSMEDGLDRVADKVVKEALEGDQFCIKEIGERLDGKSVQLVGGDEDSPIVIQEIVIRAIDATRDRPSQEGD